MKVMYLELVGGGPGHGEGLKVEPELADVVRALADGVAQVGVVRGGGGEAGVLDVRVVLPDLAAGGRDGEDAANTEAVEEKVMFK